MMAQTYNPSLRLSANALRIALFTMLLWTMALGASIVWQARIIQQQRILIRDLYKDAWGNHTASNGRV
jgi:hypothetical protein